MVGWSLFRGWFCVGVALSFGAVGCGEPDSGDSRPRFVTLTADPTYPGAPDDPARFASLFEFTPLPGCSVTNPADLGGATELRVFRGEGVSEADVAWFLGGLQRYYSQYGVTFTTRHATIAVPLREGLIFDVNVLAARVQSETGIDINHADPNALSEADHSRVTASLGAAVLHNVRELIRVYGEPRQPLVNVVLLDDIVVGNVPDELAKFKGLVGVGLSPELLASVTADDPAKDFYDWLGVDGDFTPIALVGVSLVERALDAPDIIIAHEVGHAYGLVHVTTEGNLLHQGQLDCNLELDDGQLARVAMATQAVAASGVETLSLTSRMAEFVRAVRRLASHRSE